MPNDLGHETDQQRSSTDVKACIGVVRTTVMLGLSVMLLLAGYLWLKAPGTGGQSTSGQPAIDGPFTLVDAAGGT